MPKFKQYSPIGFNSVHSYDNRTHTRLFERDFSTQSTNNDRVESPSRDRNPILRDLGRPNMDMCTDKATAVQGRSVSGTIASMELQRPRFTPVLPKWDLGIVLEALSKPP